MPADHRFRSYDDERLFPIGSNSASYQIEEFVEWSESWFRMPTLKESTKDPEQRAEPQSKRAEHELEL